MTHTFITPKGEISIRIATPAAAEALFRLRLEALTAHPEAFAADVEMTKARGIQAWAELITQDIQAESGAIIIALAGEDLVGMTGIGRGHWPKTRHSAILWGVYVQPGWRGVHIGGAILDECISWSKAHGIVVLKLGVVTTNQAAIRCYQRAGFTTYGTDPQSNFVNGVYYDEYLMMRFI